MDPNAIYKKVENHVVNLFDKNATAKLHYHNLNHTKSVVSRAKEIAGHYDLTEKDMLVVYIAAWFHDTGYLFSKPSGHELKSAELMRKFMLEQSQDEALIVAIEQGILATRFSALPINLVQEILRDADTYHFGTKEFKDNNKKVMAEMQATNPDFDKIAASEKTIEMLQLHQYYTDYCKEILDDGKLKNISRLKKKQLEKEAIEEQKPVSKESAGLIAKGIQTMLRLTSENQMKLSDMADQKANILISVNAIIISVILSVLLRKIQTETYLLIPTVIFLLVSVVTIVISILATRPKITNGQFSDQDIIDKKTNLLFFGNFHKSTLEQYDLAMRKMMKDPDYLYGSVIKDIYYLAVVLGKKYKLIRLAYNIFMVGIIVSVLAFAIATILQPAESVIINNASGTPL